MVQLSNIPRVSFVPKEGGEELVRRAVTVLTEW